MTFIIFYIMKVIAKGTALCHILSQQQDICFAAEHTIQCLHPLLYKIVLSSALILTKHKRSP